MINHSAQCPLHFLIGDFESTFEFVSVFAYEESVVKNGVDPSGLKTLRFETVVIGFGVHF